MIATARVISITYKYRVQRDTGSLHGVTADIRLRGDELLPKVAPFRRLRHVVVVTDVFHELSEQIGQRSERTTCNDIAGSGSIWIQTDPLPHRARSWRTRVRIGVGVLSHRT